VFPWLVKRAGGLKRFRFEYAHAVALPSPPALSHEWERGDGVPSPASRERVARRAGRRYSVKEIMDGLVHIQSENALETRLKDEPSYGEDSLTYHEMRNSLTYELDPGFRRDDAVLAMIGKPPSLLRSLESGKAFR
jgi:hypothetical protein